ncbi:hypothetical protein JQ634_00045 [Bradyrhizobium sp. AUGA SZCCT0240]|jgi:hypothetical protein|uniref:hypothetical protein n=1 Tax=unclassified Bradyrhizobium TaxID=2631580 RepID=UPI001BA5C4D7|nr:MULTISPECIES: hypothetical protein [unclassified Bradyrhizobium]MBR1190843.1 hypothetical protein [Bradyrhizobium sp. AUGA SZCCT0160]MBR1196054.1 hypothetical protein [Bradyrhizobium sp. AUGA SZCCT0158]MBR1240891.1 hypothetical protein [Bradyrhizobium sp. AUGA SZCCT0274]MBR1252086.1 hypothetical protein [Bradyrhizobium sp. AUGA SZCCT0240]
MKWLGVATLLIAGAAVFCVTAYPSVTVRYRLTLEAQVDGVTKTGAGVIEVTYSKQSRFAGQSPGTVGYRGEAVVLDLGFRGTLFALLKEGADLRSTPETIILRAFNFPGGALPEPIDEGLKQLRRISGSRELPLTSLPLLVRFRDMNDPKTVEKVDPIDIGRSFGDGTKLVRATVEIVPVGIWPLNSVGITGEPLTTGIDKRLSWLPKHYNVKLDGQRYETVSASLRLANSLASGFFKAGF